MGLPTVGFNARELPTDPTALSGASVGRTSVATRISWQQPCRCPRARPPLSERCHKSPLTELLKPDCFVLANYCWSGSGRRWSSGDPRRRPRSSHRATSSRSAAQAARGARQQSGFNNSVRGRVHHLCHPLASRSVCVRARWNRRAPCARVAARVWSTRRLLTFLKCSVLAPFDRSSRFVVPFEFEGWSLLD